MHLRLLLVGRAIPSRLLPVACLAGLGGGLDSTVLRLLLLVASRSRLIINTCPGGWRGGITYHTTDATLGLARTASSASLHALPKRADAAEPLAAAAQRKSQPSPHRSPAGLRKRTGP